MDHFLPFSGQNRLFLGGGRGGPRNLIFIGILLFLLLRSPCKNLKSYDTPFRGFNNGSKNMWKKLPKIVATFVCASSHGQHTHSARPIFVILRLEYFFSSSCYPSQLLCLCLLLILIELLVRAECVRCPWLLAQTKVATILGIFPHLLVLVLVTLLPFTPEGIVVGF